MVIHLCALEPVEDGVDFESNALIKAQALFDSTGIPALADDSGLIVDVLGNAPGILSARWSGVHGDDLANNTLLLNQLEGLPPKLRRARFITACVLVTAEGAITTTGEMCGQIITQMCGENGFGYDVIFVPDELEGTEFAGLTTAQIDSALKNKISHRGKAVRAMIPHLVKLF
ncbi:non-canonical purine NTP pyrophosphatase [Actinomycetota bacterium]|nr:non-canonical purine NTP pyrophosphatase [Actinomycetota bacterium]